MTRPRSPLGPWRGRRTHALALVAVALLGGGCAQRQLVAQPHTTPGGTTWAAVWIAGGLSVAVVGVLLTLPAWRRRGGARLAVLLLTAQTGLVAVTGIVLAAVAVRGWQLANQPGDAAPAVALVRLSRVDGDKAFFELMGVTVIVLTVLFATLTAATARMARGSDPLERSIASALLAIELGASGYAIVRLVLGAHGLPYEAPALAFPLLLLAFITCWPRVRAAAPS